MKEKILLSMDDSEMIKQCKQILQKYDLEIEEVDIQEYDLSKINKEKVILVILDMNMRDRCDAERIKLLKTEYEVKVVNGQYVAIVDGKEVPFGFDQWGRYTLLEE